MESGTLDFEDLMDTGDEYPGFEISKFTPANDKEDNDDSILRTPTHEQEDDFELKESTNNHNSETPHAHEQSVEQEMADVPEPDVDDNLLPEVEDEPEESEPPAKKKMYLQPPKPKMKLWNKNKDDNVADGKPSEAGDVDTEDHLSAEGDDDNIPNGDDFNSSKKTGVDAADDCDADDGGADDGGADDGGADDGGADDGGVDDDDDDVEVTSDKGQKEGRSDDPHQQSFLSFLNLQKGMSKPKGSSAKKEEEAQQKEFFSRKRLRTRKKVSYVYEDQFQSDDDDYVAEDDEEEDRDHTIDLTSPRRRSRTNSRGKITPTASPGMNLNMNYTQALQNLLPGVDLAFMEKQKRQQLQLPLPKMSSKARNNMAINSMVLATGNTSGQGVKGLFECGICGTFFSTASQFIAHQETEHSGQKKTGQTAMETFRCEICNFVLTNRFAYLEHKKMKHMKPVQFACGKCKVGFASAVELQKHQKNCSIPTCFTCNMKFGSWVEVGEHRIKVHNAAQPMTRQWLTCSITSCQFKCLTKHELQTHIKTKHVITESYGCNAPKCAKVFSTRAALQEHKKQNHSSEFIVQYQCVECKSCFSSKTLLAEHQYLHTMEKLRKCDLCSRSFSTFTDLRRHREVHVQKGVIRCQACQQWFADRKAGSNHNCAASRNTLSLRLYFCDVCKKDFRSDDKMFEHRREHKNVYHCAGCFKAFNNEEEYIAHRETHGKFTCLECFEEVTKDLVDLHKKAHQYYVKVEDMINDGKPEKVMFLCPNLLNVVKG